MCDGDLGLQTLRFVQLQPQAWMAGADLPLPAVVSNLVMVTLGNIVGGAGGVALAYRYAFLGGRRH